MPEHFNFHEWVQDRALPGRELIIQDCGHETIIFSRKRKRPKNLNGHCLEFSGTDDRGHDASGFLAGVADWLLLEYGLE